MEQLKSDKLKLETKAHSITFTYLSHSEPLVGMYIIKLGSIHTV